MVGSGMVIGLLSLVFVSQYSQTRIWYAMSRDGLLPEVFSSLHPKKKIPHWCIWIGGAAMALLAGLIGIGEAGDVVINGALVAFAVVPICVIALRKTQPERPRRIKVPWAPWLPLASLAATLVMMASLPLISWIRFAGWLAIGLVIYLGYGRRHSTLAVR
jgi:APA family basic amino acid/polyamine antiporter